MKVNKFDKSRGKKYVVSRSLCEIGNITFAEYLSPPEFNIMARVS